jgi:phosphatidate cytidylyltransferase
MSFRKRLPTALVLLVLFFLIIQFLPRVGYFLAIQLLVIGALFEFYNLFRKKGIYPQKTVGIVFALVISLSFFFEMVTLEMVLFLCLFLAAVYFVISIKRIEKLMPFPSSFAITFFGAIYLSFTLNFFYLLRIEKGPFYVYFLLGVIFLGDTGAYLFGKFWGRRKLAPMASPKKTWEGSFGGILCACLGALVAQQVLLSDIALWKALLCGILVHVVAQFSDPFESLFKRAAGIKDSSRILPGHGGILDRIDSLILAGPFFYYFIKFFWK